MVESFLVIDTRRISFNSYVTIHSKVALLFLLCLNALFYLSKSFFVYSSGQSPMVFFDFLEQCRSASGTLVRAMQRSQAGTAPFLCVSPSSSRSSQALISQRPSSTSSYRVRHHSFASPERYIVAIVTWSSIKRGTNSLKVLFHVPEDEKLPWHFGSR